jgi:CDP-glucose 4,6-dehydratase
MENLVNINSEFWNGRSVFLTGHTGFKGGWLAVWLHRLGAVIHGYALDPPTRPSLFEAAAIHSLLATDTRADLADAAALQMAVRTARPEIIFHLAAQPLVRASYQDPAGTCMSNVMGTANLLDAARACAETRAVIVITTDKVYQNHESLRAYREDDPLGGHDPYSASKAAAEIVTAAYRSSFFHGPAGHPACVATARAGNVIGGGDWAADRLVPDCLRAFAAHQPVHIRFPAAVRPWQHVLEPLAGYLILARHLCDGHGSEFARAWNFGPAASDNATVGDLTARLAALWGTDALVSHDTSGEHPHEAGLLRLDSSAARHQLGWVSRCGLHSALRRTVEWHQQWLLGADMLKLTQCQIEDYQNTPAPK